MKRKGKKIIAFLLSFVTMLTSLGINSMSAFASENAASHSVHLTNTLEGFVSLEKGKLVTDKTYMPGESVSVYYTETDELAFDGIRIAESSADEELEIPYETAAEGELTFLMPDKDIDVTPSLKDKTVSALSNGISTMALVPGKRSVLDVLNVNTNTYLDYIRKYSDPSNKYYLGTPYPTNAQINSLGNGVADFRSPNGDKWQGFGLMQCTGFVWHVLTKCGANGASTPHIALRSKWYNQKPYDYTRWYNWLRNHNVSTHDYANKSAMLNSGTLNYGDIIWIWDENTGKQNSSDYHHIGIYIGDGKSDKMWHSYQPTGNIISEIKGKASRVSYTVVDVVEPGYIKIKKASANPSLTSGNSNYSFEDGYYGIWKDEACTVGTGVGFYLDKNGESEVKEMEAGVYYVREITPPKGYIKDPTVYRCEVKAGQVSTATIVNVKDSPMTAKISVEKTSAMSECTDGSKLYSLEGAEYSVYKDAGCTQLAGKMTTDKDGKASLDGLALNRYWVKETKAPDGYTIDTKVYPVDLRSGTTAVVEATVKSQDMPIMDPAAILLFKVDKETGGPAQNNGSLGGAQFEVKFYGVLSDTDPALDGEKPLRTWTFETGDDGYLDYNQEYLVSGDDLYTDVNGNPQLPYGTLTFKEIKAPEGYLVNSELIVVRTDGYSAGNIVYQTPTQEEDDLELRLTKIDSTTGKPVPGAVFTHTMPDGSTKEYTTDKDGFIDISCLEYGTHKLKEKNVPDGFAVNTAEIEFKVAEDNSITIIKGNKAETDNNGKITVDVADDGCLEVRIENKPAPYRLLVHKENEDGKVLEGAEFTLYSDASCKTVVKTGTTDSKGELYFDGLIVGKTYYLKETDAPAGYRIPVNADGSDIIYQVHADAKVMDNKFTFIVNGKSYTSDEGTYHVEGTKADRVCAMDVINQTGQLLPETGSNSTLLLISVGLLLVIAAGTVALKRKKH